MPTDPANVCSLSKTGREGRTTKMTRLTLTGHDAGKQKSTEALRGAMLLNYHLSQL
jgi:hypothetical protein